ncbi:MAG: hypothetical protein EOO48_00950 [Flavobacterium sp.]|nr:MAG: hypothetical protein EOO48_00950 [Flavobacterium sp.]
MKFLKYKNRAQTFLKVCPAPGTLKTSEKSEGFFILENSRKIVRAQTFQDLPAQWTKASEKSGAFFIFTSYG